MYCEGVWCAWCETKLKGRLSDHYGICHSCRKSPEGKAMIKRHLEKTTHKVNTTEDKK